MKRHHLSFKGVPLETVSAIKVYLTNLSAYLAENPANIEVQTGALAECFVSLAGEAIEMQTLLAERVRAQLVEMRAAIALRQARPELTPLEQHVLGTVINHGTAISTVEILTKTHLARTTVNGCLRQLVLKGRLSREFRGQVGYWSPTEKGREFQPACEPEVPQAAASILPMQTAVLHLSVKPWHQRGRGPAKR